ncbi:MAG: hypothetical protein ACI9MC_000487 [Kiritimatiellia bacterium]|jgi:hypothetical protein
MEPFAILFIVLGTGALVLLASGPAMALQRSKRTAQREAYRLAEQQPVLVEDRLVLSYGRGGAGEAPKRGNGTLLCTADKLIFVRWSPRSRLIIPRHKIRSVRAPSSHNGKDAGTPLLSVIFEDASGEEEAIAWLVRDRRAWAMALARSAASAPTNPL